MEWRCPVCREPLQADGRSLACANRHRFDRAKEGYVNLLLANRKNSADPGDSKAMLGSRRRFLQQGFYDPLADSLAAAIRQQFPDSFMPLNLLDAGCGEGYYLGRLIQQLGSRLQAAGTDISRAAMRMAARRYPDARFAVASSFDLPLADASVDALVRVFAPASDTEVARVLKPDGLYLWAHPGERHLFELRQRVYDNPQLHAVNTEKTAAEVDLSVVDTLEVSYPLHLPDQGAVADLLEMTPYYWSASAAKQQACQRLQSLDLTVDFRVTVMRKGNKANSYHKCITR